MGSTALNVRTGDAAWVDLVEEHDHTVRSCLRQHGGVEFKHTGDGIGAWFANPADAVDCAMQMGRDLERASVQHPDTPLMMRAGVAMGEPVEYGGDLFGLSVVRASRACATPPRMARFSSATTSSTVPVALVAPSVGMVSGC